ncbi:hypothetical protein LWF01_02920 [Saxibacter everestensis]|uniref:Phage portal protein n=1 Tax=Saxibacter everestensis TaxID=2909229 RepID=A0ABY8QVA7_9MICO|nr:hypothetical protein LWF01_02920 [Brevibacteriaceae bacterium ZFBP1038]
MNRLRSEYVAGEKLVTKLGFSIPPGMESFQLVVGWPAKACEVLSARLLPRGFSLPSTSTLIDDLDDVFGSNQMEYVERTAIDAAVKHGVSFVFTSRGDTTVGEPEELVTARTALSASAEMDPRSRRITSALELLGGTRVNLYLPGRVLVCVRRPSGWMVEDEYATASSRVLCTPYVHNASIEKPFGSSRVTRPLMGYTDAAVRTLLREEVSAEFYSAPRQSLLGADESVFVDQDGNLRPAWAAIIGAVWAIPDEEDELTGERHRPDLKTLPQMTMQPHNDQLRMIAQMASGETGIPLSYLGVMQDSNPTSADAIHANEIDLVRIARGQFPSLGMGREQLARDVLTLRHGEVPEQELRGLKSRWEDPRSQSITEQSQFVAQQVSSGNFQPGSRATLDQLPITPEEAERFATENARLAGQSQLQNLLAQDAPTGSGGQ